MAIQYDKASSLFQVDYQAPFGGVDSTAYASAIDPHNFVSMQGMIVEDNLLKPFLLKQIPYKTNPSPLVGNYLGFIPIAQALVGSVVLGYVITSESVYKLSADTVTPNNLDLTLIASYAPALSGGAPFDFNYIVIDQVQTGLPTMYWTLGGWSEIWGFDTQSSTASLLTNYVGGGVLGLLNNQLLNLGGVSALDGPVPNRISWSAPGQYGVFQPYDVPSATGNYAAGFNDLPSVSDILTGFVAIGTVGYLFRTEGITQVNVTGNGVLPFQFNHLWASEVGIGTPFPFSLSQYGSICAFVTDAGIYTLGLNGLNEIGGQARTYLYSLINQQRIYAIGSGTPFSFQLRGRLVPYLNTSPELHYILAVAFGTNPAVFAEIEFLAIKVSTGAVYDLGPQLAQNQATAGIALSFYFPSVLRPSVLFIPSRVINCLVIANQAGTTAPNFYGFTLDSTAVGTIAFRKEQLKFGYMPTVSKLGFLAALIDDTTTGSIQAGVTGSLEFTPHFPALIITNGVGNPGNGIIDNVYMDGIETLERPQLFVQLRNVMIAEFWMQGTLADYPVI